jgi:hypothetical protein
MGLDINLIISSIINNPTNFIACCALFVSICSFILTIYTIWTQRRHDRLSVKPLVNIHVEDFPERITITVQNDGLGPMIIKSVECFKNGDVSQQNVGWPPITFRKSDFTILNATPRFTKGLEGCPILNGKFFVIFQHEIDPNNPNQTRLANITRDSFKELSVKVKYASIFDDEQFEKIISLEGFGKRKYY